MVRHSILYAWIIHVCPPLVVRNNCVTDKNEIFRKSVTTLYVFSYDNLKKFGPTIISPSTNKPTLLLLSEITS